MANFFGPEDVKQLERERADAGHITRELTADELQIIEKKRQALAKLFEAPEIAATYKIELNFGKDRSTSGHFPGSLIVFLSGSALSGDGDEPVFPCPNDRCSGFIPPKLVSSMLKIAICPTCGTKWPQKQLHDTRLFRLAPPDWARVLARYFVRLGHDADIYLKGHPIDIRVQTEAEQQKAHGGEKLNAARARRVRVIYPLHRIYTDLRNGADLEKRFLALLRA